jgi:peptidylprolyl isomerase
MRRSELHRIALICALATMMLSGGCDRHPEWTTPSGLQITEIAEGEGSLGKKGDIMFIVYTASYVGGDQFDSYQDRSEPYRFRLGFEQVLPGLEEGVATMRPGGRRILILPPELAFGKEGQGMVPADTWVKFDVGLVKIEPGPVPPTPWSDVGYEIVVTETGLQYIDYVIGDGESPTRNSEIIVHYSGFLDDGTVFDSSYFGGAPVRFSLKGGELIPGWIEGIATMREGGQRKLIIPPYLAYGEVGYRKSIPPNATLTYDIWLLSVRDAEP